MADIQFHPRLWSLFGKFSILKNINIINLKNDFSSLARYNLRKDPPLLRPGGTLDVRRCPVCAGSLAFGRTRWFDG